MKWCLHFMFDEIRSVSEASEFEWCREAVVGDLWEKLQGTVKGDLKWQRGINHWWEGVGKSGQCGEHLGERRVAAGCTDLGFGCLELMARVRGMRFILQERPINGSLGQNEAGR